MAVYIFSKRNKETGSTVHVHDCKKAENVLLHPKEGGVQKSLAGKLLTFTGDLDNMPPYYPTLYPLRSCPHCHAR